MVGMLPILLVFSSLELNNGSNVNLRHSYHDFEELSHLCKFRGCLHDSEPYCAVKEAVTDAGDI